MKQLVSVVTDDAVAYFVHDGDEALQIARLINPGLDVAAVLELGTSLAHVLRVDGRRPLSRRPVEAPAIAPPATPDVEAKRARRAEAQRTHTQWGISRNAVLDDLRHHPGATYSEIAHRLTKSRDPKAVQTVSATVHDLRRHGYRIVSEKVMGLDKNGRAQRRARLTLVEEPGASA